MKSLVCILLSSFLLLGCSSQQTAPQPSVQKATNTTLSGTVTASSGKYYIGGAGQAPTEISSYTVKLDAYTGKKVTVTGQYSGTTLFVDTVQQP